ncbi:hypothetical protein KM043_007884 [Ampulex compressa]|nr:hypothetical protein KM043_007884 [Ampulex compressa]
MYEGSFDIEKVDDSDSHLILFPLRGSEFRHGPGRKRAVKDGRRDATLIHALGTSGSCQISEGLERHDPFPPPGAKIRRDGAPSSPIAPFTAPWNLREGCGTFRRTNPGRETAPWKSSAWSLFFCNNSLSRGVESPWTSIWIRGFFGLGIKSRILEIKLNKVEFWG